MYHEFAVALSLSLSGKIKWMKIEVYVIDNTVGLVVNLN
jgi:hypothetical protein